MRGQPHLLGYLWLDFGQQDVQSLRDDVGDRVKQPDTEALPTNFTLPLQATAQQLLVNPVVEVLSFGSSVALLVIFAIDASKLPPGEAAMMGMVEYALTSFFVAEYMARAWLHAGNLRYLLRSVELKHLP